MALSGAQLIKLKSSQQRADCRFVTFAARSAATVGTITTGTYTFKDMINIHPRYSWVANSATIVLDGTDSQKRTKAAVTGYTWALTGSGSINDNADGTCDYTAPGAGTGTATVKLTSDGNALANNAYIAYGELAQLNIGEVTSFSSSTNSGAWEMKVKVRGDCTGLERQKGILLVVNDYWNGSEDTFGGYKWADGVFFGYIDRFWGLYQDAGEVYAEYTIQSPNRLLDYGRTPDVHISKTDTDAVVVADFEVIDASWILVQESGVNTWLNCWFWDDTTSVASLKLGEGPLWSVITDIAKRTFGITYSDKLGNLYVKGDPWVRTGGGAGEEFEIGTDLYERVRFTNQKFTDETTPSDPQYGQAILQGIQANLSEIKGVFPASAVSGLKTTKSGLICENAATLVTWAETYYQKMHAQMTGTIDMFLMHHVDLYTRVGLAIGLRAGDISNTDYAVPDSLVVTGADFKIMPGMQTWVGQISVESIIIGGS